MVVTTGEATDVSGTSPVHHSGKVSATSGSASVWQERAVPSDELSALVLDADEQSACVAPDDWAKRS